MQLNYQYHLSKLFLINNFLISKIGCKYLVNIKMVLENNSIILYEVRLKNKIIYI